MAVVVVSWEALPLTVQSEAPTSVFTEAQAAAGKAAYESVCVNCHTYALTGRKCEPGELPAVNDLAETFRDGIQQAGGRIPALAGKDFLRRCGDRTTKQLSVRIATAIDGFPPTGVDDNTANNLAAYFLKVSGARAGTRELGSPETLDVLVRDAVSSRFGR